MAVIMLGGQNFKERSIYLNYVKGKEMESKEQIS